MLCFYPTDRSLRVLCKANSVSHNVFVQENTHLKSQTERNYSLEHVALFRQVSLLQDRHIPLSSGHSPHTTTLYLCKLYPSLLRLTWDESFPLSFPSQSTITPSPILPTGVFTIFKRAKYPPVSFHLRNKS